MSAPTRLTRGGERGSSLSTLKKILLSLIAVGLLGTVTYHRTYAALSGDTTNGGATNASGTLVVGDQLYQPGSSPATSGSECQSWQAATKDNANVSCSGLLFSAGTTTLRFPGQISTSNLAIRNAGSLNARELQLSIATCTTTTTTGAPAYVGTGDPCVDGGLDLYVQERTSSTFATNLKCVFPSPAAAAGGGFPDSDCTALTPPTTTQDSVASLKGLGATGCWDLGGVTANTTRYFTVGMEFDPTTATNNIQGRTTVVKLRWHLVGGNNRYDAGGNPTETWCANDPVDVTP